MPAPHPYSATVLGLYLRDLASDAERELILSLSEQPQTAAIWPIYQTAGATDQQIDATLRAPGQRCSLTTNYSQRRSHHWYWRGTKETGFFFNGALALSGPALFTAVRRLLGITEPADLVGTGTGAPVESESPRKVARAVDEDNAYAELCRAHQVGHLVCETAEEMAARIRDEMAELASRAEELDEDDEDGDDEEAESLRTRLDYLLEEWVSRDLHRAGAPLEARR